MAIIENVKNGIKDKVDTYIRGIVNSVKIDDEHEFSLIADLHRALGDTPKDKSIYKAISNYFEVPIDLTALNIKGIKDRSLDFYNKYIQSANLDIISKSVVGKMIDDTLRINGEMADLEIFKKIALNSVTYGTILINISNLEKFKFDIIEPYRYEVKKDTEGNIFEAWIYVDTGLKQIGQGQHQTIDQVHRIDTGAVIKEYLTSYYIDYAGKFRQYGTVIETELDNIYLYEWQSESLIEPIRNELLILDTVDTAIALEIKGTQFSIHTDSKYFEEGRFIKQDVYRIYNSDGLDQGEKPLFETYSPNIREQNYINLKEHYLKVISTDMGLNLSALGLANVNHTTATASLIEENRTVDTINSLRSNFRSNINNMLNQFDIEIEVTAYQSQNMETKARLVTQLRGNTSTEWRVKYLNPDMEEQDLLREIVLVKIEEGLPMTKEENLLATKEGLIEDVQFKDY